jgi:hypothetical protein
VPSGELHFQSVSQRAMQEARQSMQLKMKQSTMHLGCAQKPDCTSKVIIRGHTKHDKLFSPK